MFTLSSYVQYIIVFSFQIRIRRKLLQLNILCQLFLIKFILVIFLNLSLQTLMICASQFIDANINMQINSSEMTQIDTSQKFNQQKQQMTQITKMVNMSSRQFWCGMIYNNQLRIIQKQNFMAKYQNTLIFVFFIIFGNTLVIHDFSNNSERFLQSNFNAYYQNFIIQTNRMKIQNVNAINSNFVLKENQYIKYTEAQFAAMFLTLQVPTSNVNNSPNSTITAGNSQNNLQGATSYGLISAPISIDIDWTRSGVVTSIKSQGSCGGCWAFSAVSDLQSTYILKGSYNNRSIDLSEQQLIDCSGAYYNFGCNGGWMTNAFAYAYKYPITTQSNYPFVQQTQNCNNNKGTFTITNLRSYWQNNNCQLLVDILNLRPVAIAVAADPLYWGFYSSGILNQCTQTINHGVNLVGVFQNSTQNYWIIKNSWGTSWGQNGYIRVDRNSNNGNLCSICSYPQYSIL